MTSSIKEWKGGNLCSAWCTNENGSTSGDACLSCVLPCYTFADIQQKNNPNSIWCGNFVFFAIVDYLGFGCCLTCATRAHINPTEGCCSNCMTSMCCQPCALTQALKTIELKDANGNVIPEYRYNDHIAARMTDNQDYGRRPEAKYADVSDRDHLLETPSQTNGM